MRLRLVAGVGTVILLAGIAYAFDRQPTYESAAELVVVPEANAARDLSASLGPKTSRETEGTAVELLDSRHVQRRAGAHPVNVTARQILDPASTDFPWTNAIRVTTRSESKGAVQPALTHVITAAMDHEAQLGRLWRFKELSAPSAPSEDNPTTGVLLVAIPLLALLGALAAWILARTLPPRSVVP